MRPEKNGIYMDQMSFLLQALSVSYDGDLQYTQRDRQRFLQLGWGDQPVGLFLRKSGERYFFAKPAAYGILAAPFTRFAPNRGCIVLNALLWCGTVLLTFLWLKRWMSEAYAALLALACWGLSAAFFYVFVIHPDLFIVFLLTAFLYIALVPVAERRLEVKHLWAAILGVIAGILVYEKLPIVFFVIALLALWATRGYRRAAAISIAVFALVSCVFAGIHMLEDGHPFPYQGDRIVVSQDPFSTRSASAESNARTRTGEFFNLATASGFLSTSRIAAVGGALPRLFSHYFFGRTVGMVPYLTPFFLLLVIAVVRLVRPAGRHAYWLLLPAVAYIIFYFIILPFNYHGGATALGNRYGLQIAPAFVFCVANMRLARMSGAALLVFLAVAAAYFPGQLLLQPATAVRDHFHIAQWSRFSMLPMEEELLARACDKDDSRFDVDPQTTVFRLSEAGITDQVPSAFWLGETGSSRFAIIRRKQIGEPIQVRVSSSSYTTDGFIESGPHRTPFRLEPLTTKEIVPEMARPTVTRFPPMHEFYWPLRIVVSSSKETSPPLRLFAGACLHVQLAQPITSEQEDAQIFSLNPADPAATSRLLWGWWGTAGGPAATRWAGGTRATAIALPVREGSSMLTVTGSTVGSPLDVTVRTAKGTPQRFTLHSHSSTTTLHLKTEKNKGADEIILFEHEGVRIPAVLTGNSSADQRALTALYTQFIVQANTKSQP